MKLIPVYNGRSIENLTNHEIAIEILRHYDIPYDINHITVMEEMFRCGWLRGEDYANSMKN